MIFLSFCEDLLRDCAEACADGWVICPASGREGKCCCPIGAQRRRYDPYPLTSSRARPFADGFDGPGRYRHSGSIYDLGLYFRQVALGSLAVQEFGRAVSG